MELGWPLPRREEYFRNAREGPVEPHRLRFQGEYKSLSSFCVPITLPKYRLENGRTVSLQAEWLADSPSESADFFRRDPESDRAQEVQHGLLLKLIKGKGLDEFFRNAANKQDIPLILDSHGFVVNGNRRLCCWRELHHVDSGQYGHFSHVRVVVLPPADERAIDRLEAELQVTQDIREEYTWDTLANMLYERREQHGYTEEELGELYEKTVLQIRELLEMREYALQYMESRGKPNHWTMVRGRGTEHAFRKILKARKQAHSPLDTRIIEAVSFTLIDDPEGLGRLYDAIPKLGEQLPKLKERLQQELHLEIGASNTPSDPTGFFGGEEGGDEDAALARAIEREDNRAVLRDVAKDLIDEGRILDAEEKSASYVRKKLQKAHSEIQNALNGINESSSKTGVLEQISAIEDGLTAIRKWMDVDA